MYVISVSDGKPQIFLFFSRSDCGPGKNSNQPNRAQVGIFASRLTENGVGPSSILRGSPTSPAPCLWVLVLLRIVNVFTVTALQAGPVIARNDATWCRDDGAVPACGGMTAVISCQGPSGLSTFWQSSWLNIWSVYNGCRNWNCYPEYRQVCESLRSGIARCLGCLMRPFFQLAVNCQSAASIYSGVLL